MASVQFILYATLFLALISEGMSQQRCPVETISIEQQETGRIVKGKTEYQVIVINICDCPQKNVTLDCDGFQTVEDPDPAIFTKTEASCVLLHGKKVVPSIEVDFTYAWDEEYPFYLLSAAPAC
ncbi:putative Beta-1,3-N-Acetylglucosaminyltransferase family protein [Melia azedarach]|uniref:Beta-1,3-N-Acetylglucosaminyltransferase family protein n=1 Tax=Melia azedarach TaxID=155640 RepID=A0ACC1X9Z1_MELAZ|nr:putative Beta-1,3-N-Acetylglucosaminyltransferase family protein [Melia azedarach]